MKDCCTCTFNHERQTCDYYDECVANDYCNWATTPKTLLEVAIEALQYYANKDVWRDAEADRLNNEEDGFFTYYLDECPIAKDKGKIAREALEKLKK